jgi:exosome complex component RRP4
LKTKIDEMSAFLFIPNTKIDSLTINFTISLSYVVGSSSRNVYALLIIDVQYCFINGSLALSKSSAHQDGAAVIPIINNLIKTVPFDVLAYSLDWHPKNHISFFNNLKDRKKYVLGGHYKKYKVFDIVTYTGPKYDAQQVLWPAHCIGGTDEARLDHNLIRLPESADVIHIKKGTDPDIDSYSAFADNNRVHMTSLNHDLKARHVTHVFVTGLALDYCVGSTAIDAADLNYKTYVIEDACRGVDEQTIQKKLDAMKNRGIDIIQSDQVKGIVDNGTSVKDINMTCSRRECVHDML